MELTTKQESGLKIAIDRYRNHEPYTCIAGYAGTGKTTLVRFIVSALDLDPEDVAYIAFTGKAALVLRDKGCPNAMTAHKLLYKSKQRNDGTYYHIPRTELPVSCKIIVVDEVSMLPKPIWDLLLTHRIHVVAMGDPGQLPPIGEDNGILQSPHIFLDEIVRQAAESEIIRLSSDVRHGKPLQIYKGNEINITTIDELCNGMYAWADQIICGKNNTRHALNAAYRRMKWGEDVSSKPIVGDKVICLHNNWDKVTEAGDALVNGMIGEISNFYTMPNDLLGKKFFMDFVPDGYNEKDMIYQQDYVFRNLLADWKLLTTGEPTVNKENFKYFPKFLRPEQFDYGYCITCHKAQGSEYNKVLIFEEVLKSTEHARWLYTAITRAKEKVTIIKCS